MRVDGVVYVAGPVNPRKLRGKWRRRSLVQSLLRRWYVVGVPWRDVDHVIGGPYWKRGAVRRARVANGGGMQRFGIRPQRFGTYTAVYRTRADRKARASTRIRRTR